MIEDMQSKADLYGADDDEACVIILVFMTSIGCVASPAINADDIPISRLSPGDNFSCPFFSWLRCLNSKILRCNNSLELNVAMTKGTLRDTVGFQAL